MNLLHLTVGRHSFHLTIAALLAALSANAAALTWDANGPTFGQPNGSGAWLGSNQWWNGSANQTWSSGSDATFGGLNTAGGAVTLASPTTVNTITFNQFTGTYTLGTIGQAITVNNGITTTGAGIVTFISPLVLGGAQEWTNNSSSAINVEAATALNGPLTVGGIGNTSFGAVISGSGGINKQGPGSITLSGANTYSGGTTLRGPGTLSINSASALGSTSGPLTVDEGTLNMQGNSLTVGNLTGTGGTITGTSGNRTLTIGQGNFEGVIEDGVGGTTALGVSGGGGVTLAGANTYSGGTTLRGSGTFTINSASALGSTSGPLTVDDGTLNMQGNSLTVGNLTGTGGIITGTSGNRTLTIGQGNGTGGDFQGVIEDGAGGTTALVKTGSGNITLSGVNTYSGGTMLQAGTFNINSLEALGSASGPLTVDGGTLNMQDNSLTVGILTGRGGTITGTSVNRTLTIGQGNGTGGNFQGMIEDGAGGTTAIVKTGTGSITLSGANTYSGGTTLSAGTLSINSVGALGSDSSPLIVNAGTLNMQGNSLTVGNLIGTAGTITGTSGARTLNIGEGDGTPGEFGGVIEDGSSGTTALVKTGSGILTLYGENTYSGGTKISNGTFTINSPGALGAASGPLTVDGGTVDMDGNSLTVGNLTGTGGTITGTSGARTLTIGEGNGTGGNFEGVIEDGAGGTTALVKIGSGSITLSGANTYSGGTTLRAGTLTINSVSALGSANVFGNTVVSIGAATLATAVDVSDAVGTLDPTSAATIHIDAGATLAFARSTSMDWTGGSLNITGTFVPGNLGSLRFGDNLSQPGLVSAQLNKITAVGYTGFGLDANGYLTATDASFSAWVSVNAPGKTIDQDHDNDGVSNGVEYFMGLSGNGFTANPGPNASNVISWPKGASYTGIYGTHYSIQNSSDLGVRDPWTDVPLPNVTIDGNSVDYDLDTAPAGSRKFSRLKVTGP